MKLLYIPNLLTTLRISLIPLFIFMFYYPSKWAFLYTTLIFAIAGITDWLDGYLARKLKQTSAIGAFLDPVADKLIVVVALVLLTESHNSLIMAKPFTNYLKNFLFKNFDLESGKIDLSRHSLAHGVAKEEDYTRVRALQMILILDQIYFYL